LGAHFGNNKLGKATQDQIRGGGRILSVIVPAGSVRAIARLKNLKRTNNSIYKKLDTYLLDKTHKANKGKADFFQKVLGFELLLVLFKFFNRAIALTLPAGTITDNILPPPLI
jgi:hypothetical protein